MISSNLDILYLPSQSFLLHAEGAHYTGGTAIPGWCLEWTAQAPIPSHRSKSPFHTLSPRIRYQAGKNILFQFFVGMRLFISLLYTNCSIEPAKSKLFTQAPSRATCSFFAPPPGKCTDPGHTVKPGRCAERTEPAPVVPSPKNQYKSLSSTQIEVVSDIKLPTTVLYITENINLPVGELNPGLPRDRRGY